MVSKRLAYEKELIEFKDKIRRCEEAASDIVGYPVTIPEAIVIYYTGQFREEKTKQDLQATIETAETYHWYLGLLKKRYWADSY